MTGPTYRTPRWVPADPPDVGIVIRGAELLEWSGPSVIYSSGLEHGVILNDGRIVAITEGEGWEHGPDAAHSSATSELMDDIDRLLEEFS